MSLTAAGFAHRMSGAAGDEDGFGGVKNDWQVDALLQQFSGTNVHDRDATLARFGEVTRLTPAEARHFLESKRSLALPPLPCRRIRCYPSLPRAAAPP